MQDAIDLAIEEVVYSGPTDCYAAGYRLASLCVENSARCLNDKLFELPYQTRELIERYLPVCSFFTPDELAFEIRRQCFGELEPIIGIFHDTDSEVRAVTSATSLGESPLPEDSWCWDDDVRPMHLFKLGPPNVPNPILVSTAIGEFWVEIYHLLPDGTPKLIYKEDFCLK